MYLMNAILYLSACALLSILVISPSPHIYNDAFVSKNGMNVSWTYKGDRIFFEMDAPTNGWVAIGFNQKQELSGTYWIMGAVKEGNVEVVEHYTISLGNYRPLTFLNDKAFVEDIYGEEKDGKTSLRFSVPIHAQSVYTKDLSEGQTYTMHMAFSRADDFQHHSMMRTLTRIKF